MSAEPTQFTVSRLGAHGDGVVETDRGVLHVAGTLPGEVISLEHTETGRATLSRLIAASPDRVQPPCRHFGECGGCSVQHLATAAYLDWKRQLVVAAFGARGIGADVAPVVVTGGLRRRAILTAVRTTHGAVVGFHEVRRHHVVDLEVCPVLVPRLVRALPGLRRLVGTLPHTRNELRATLIAAQNGVDVALTGDGLAGVGAAGRAALARVATEYGFLRLTVGTEPVYATATPYVSFGPAMVEFPPGSFLQAVAEAEAAMAVLIDEAAPKAAQVADLFCGLGAFALRLARRARVLAVDGDAAAVAALAFAAKRTPGLKPVETKVRDLFREPLSPTELRGFDVVVFDPPRAGARAQADALARSKVPVVVAVSCDPATLARDLRILVDGGYQLGQITPVDQFHYSAHVETVAILRR